MFLRKSYYFAYFVTWYFLLYFINYYYIFIILQMPVIIECFIEYLIEYSLIDIFLCITLKLDWNFYVALMVHYHIKPHASETFGKNALLTCFTLFVVYSFAWFLDLWECIYYFNLTTYFPILLFCNNWWATITCLLYTMCSSLKLISSDYTFLKFHLSQMCFNKIYDCFVYP